MNKRWTSSNKAVYNVSFHLIWCTKYRRKVLVGKIDKRLKELLYEKAGKIGTDIAEMEVMPEHVHLFVKCDTTDSPHWIVQQFKGYTAHELRKEFKELRSKLPTLWTRSYYCESIGHISEASIRKYIESQKDK
jgi:putative transposase